MNEHTEMNLTDGRELFYQPVAYISEGRVEIMDIPIGRHTGINELMPPMLDSSELAKIVCKED